MLTQAAKSGKGVARGPVAPPLFRRGYNPPLFDCLVLPACSTEKGTAVDMLLKCLTWWKSCTKSLHLRLHFQKSSNFWGGHITPQTSPCVAQVRRPALTRHFGLTKSGPSTLKIVPPPMFVENQCQGPVEQRNIEKNGTNFFFFLFCLFVCLSVCLVFLFLLLFRMHEKIWL